MLATSDSPLLQRRQQYWNRYKMVLVCSTALISTVLCQWLHFSLYYQQPFKLSFVWSLVDWIVWFVIAGAFYKFAFLSSAGRTTFNKWHGILFILSAGPCQIILSSLIFQLIFEADKTLLESFIHLINKRWLQNLLISSVFLLVQILIAQKTSKHSIDTNLTDEDCSPNNSKFSPDESKTMQADICTPSEVPIKLDDGKRLHYVKMEDIFSLNAAKNYLSVFTDTEEIVIRASLKSFRKQLPPSSFLQISRSVVINTQHIKCVEKYSRASSRVILRNGQQHNIGRTYLPHINFH